MSLTTVTIEPSNLLTPAEHTALARLEAVIQENLKGFMNVGLALLEISRLQLYREEFDTFEGYLDERWGFGRTQAHYMIEAAEVVTNLAPVAGELPMPTAPRQLRGLASFTPEEQIEIWREACQRAGGGVPPGRIVQEVIDTRQVPKDKAIKKGSSRKAAESDEPKPYAGDEWYTPEEWAEVHRDFLGGIELDPASCKEANKTIQAERFYDQKTNGLTQSWKARTIHLNPPYRHGLIGPFIKLLLDSYYVGDFGEGILTVNANTSSPWFAPLFDFPCCFVQGRIKFVPGQGAEEAELEEDQDEDDEDESKEVRAGSARAASVFVYFGPRVSEFVQRYSQYGRVVTAMRPDAPSEEMPVGEPEPEVDEVEEIARIGWPKGVTRAEYKAWKEPLQEKGVTEGLDPWEYKRQRDAGNL